MAASAIASTLYSVNERDLALNGKTVRHMQRQRLEAEEHVAEYFFTDCLKRIMRQAKMGHTKAVYRVPEYRFNLMPNGRLIPLYESKAVAQHLCRWFRQEGFRVAPDRNMPTVLRFSWRHPVPPFSRQGREKPLADAPAKLADEARRYMQERKAIRHRIFDLFVANCKRKIRQAVRLDPKRAQTWYEVPAFKLGMPLYKMKDAIDYVTRRLEEAEFCVTKHPRIPHVLSVSWRSGYTHER